MPQTYPDAVQKYIRVVRRMMRDYPATNSILKVEELGDVDIEQALNLAVCKINATPPLIVVWRVESFPDEIFYLLALGGYIEAMYAAATLRARNELPYTDAGGISVNDDAKWGPYLQILSRREEMWRRDVELYKKSVNLEDGYGRMPSEYSGSYPFLEGPAFLNSRP